MLCNYFMFTVTNVHTFTDFCKIIPFYNAKMFTDFNIDKFFYFIRSGLVQNNNLIQSKVCPLDAKKYLI